MYTCVHPYIFALKRLTPPWGGVHLTSQHKSMTSLMFRRSFSWHGVERRWEVKDCVWILNEVFHFRSLTPLMPGHPNLWNSTEPIGLRRRADRGVSIWKGWGIPSWACSVGGLQLGVTPQQKEDLLRAWHALHTRLDHCLVSQTWIMRNDGTSAPQQKEDLMRAWHALHTRLNHCLVSKM